MQFHFLNSKELKPIHLALVDQFGFTGHLEGIFHINAKSKVYLAKRSIVEAPLDQLNVTMIGMYLCEWRLGTLRLSIEGSQLLGPHCTKNIVDISDHDVATWMRGEDVPYTGSMTGYVILRNGSDYLGCGKVGKDSILNMVGKGRRVKIIEPTKV